MNASQLLEPMQGPPPVHSFLLALASAEHGLLACMGLSAYNSI